MTMNIPILYEDDEVLAVNKPAGLVVHSDGRTKEETLADWVLEKYPSVHGVGETIPLTKGGVIEKWGIVHRIDRDTSGVLLIAKTQASFLNLKAQFQARTIKKSYRTITHGVFKESVGTIDKPIGRSKSDFRKWSSEYGARGELREAVTEYRVLGEGDAKGSKLSYLEVCPHTGRTHQIRVHLKAVGHPILCDKLYAPKAPCLLGFGRTALHAFSVVFKGQNGVEHKVEAPLPEDFKTGLAEMGII
ncbi:MAG: Pseudouridine synthase, RluA family [Parcubacteria group bacterium GW2011_GWC1_42_11]|uniref:Pseudouridine synthase n=1 Tax=Candidatus Nomurabacteria bacterium GW2011_GWC2_42_20 TaxID=1618756 RepID=A0A0G0ZEW8_9BACT|nr:MAG: Pseudouridine synthase, RluA family [Parcubacteria group bacterium GW2011_GWC1_42_11]KKS47209.1 MAG: Pseudouridine synthase, RluA family [Candidatus Nomurabacteria bacterium GW2011_GWC2_42_20]TAN36542.1 MAG: RluA family pseudouridine synthase [Patescibacteria group bacterium]HBH71740.1 RNA pseudouridine synthase [Candidatus Yonathbacteria bacterium]